jgi:hypothetical protein
MDDIIPKNMQSINIISGAIFLEGVSQVLIPLKVGGQTHSD